jgi:hypothetical protein
VSGTRKPPAAGRPRRGRPPGSDSLTAERAEIILEYVRAGAFDYVAAEAAGISARTLRDWVARCEDPNPGRPCPPKLRRFNQALRKAKAEARAATEISVREQHPRYWLSHAARSKPRREGWTDPGQEEEQTEQRFVLEDAIRARDEGRPYPPGEALNEEHRWGKDQREALGQLDSPEAVQALIDSLQFSDHLKDRILARVLRTAQEAATSVSITCPNPNCRYARERSDLP